MEYKPLTKKIVMNNQECITCALYGTDECKIHTDNIKGCGECSMITAIFNQLHAFEEVYAS